MAVLRTDTTRANEIRVDQLIAADLGPAAKAGGAGMWWRCPFHDDRHPSLHYNPRKNKAFCNVCGLALDAVGWVMAYRHLDFREAVRELSGDLVLTPASGQPYQPPALEPPSADWQRAATALVDKARATLWNGLPESMRVFNYLRRRGLTGKTIWEAELGYIPAPGRIAGLFSWPGITIPAWGANGLWSVKVRLLPGHRMTCCGPVVLTPQNTCPKCAKKHKYVGVPGGVKTLYGVRTLAGKNVAIVAEGALDQLIVYQSAGDLVGAVTGTAGANEDWPVDWTQHLLDAGRVIVVMDRDAAGDKGAAKLRALGGRVEVAQVPAGKDITDYAVKHGGDIRAWLISLIN